jgi:amidohydrolase
MSVTKQKSSARVKISESQLNSLILDKAKELHPHLIEVRRHLHRNPELSNEEFATTGFLKKELSTIGLKPFPLKAPTGILTELTGGQSGPTVAVRTDIDALPILEKTDLPFASTAPGKMHACGHDTHMATVLGTAKLLTEIREYIPGNVRFLFQPAEETPPGGARPLIEEGALENPTVCCILGLHVDPRVKTGRIGLRDGPTMASVTDIDINITGASAHAARPHEGVDSIVVAAEIVTTLQRIVSRETDPLHPVAVTIGKIEGGNARNVIAANAKLTVTLRAMHPYDAKSALKAIKRCVAGICKSYGASGKVEVLAEYPPLANTPRVNQCFEDSMTSLFGKGRVVETEQVLGGEDFACYLEHVPGAQVRLGIRNSAIGATEGWHSDRFVVDEEAIYYGVAMMAKTVLVALETYA